MTSPINKALLNTAARMADYAHQPQSTSKIYDILDATIADMAKIDGEHADIDHVKQEIGKLVTDRQAELEELGYHPPKQPR
jgi:hypothetical protein